MREDPCRSVDRNNTGFKTKGFAWSTLQDGFHNIGSRAVVAGHLCHVSPHDQACSFPSTEKGWPEPQRQVDPRPFHPGLRGSLPGSHPACRGCTPRRGRSSPAPATPCTPPRPACPRTCLPGRWHGCAAACFGCAMLLARVCRKGGAAMNKRPSAARWWRLYQLYRLYRLYRRWRWRSTGILRSQALFLCEPAFCAGA